MLNMLRIGEVTEEMVDEFRQLSRPVTYTDGIEPTELYPLRQDVDRANESRLSALTTPEHRYLASDVPGCNANGDETSLDALETILGRLLAQQEVVLKVGAQVMLIKNVPDVDLVNGSQGLVVGFMTSQEASEEKITVLQVGRAEDRTVKYGESSDEARPQGDDKLWPLVKFTNGRTILCTPAEFTVNNFRGEAEATRRQIPLICAWAMSVHKSQGQTIERILDQFRIPKHMSRFRGQPAWKPWKCSILNHPVPWPIPGRWNFIVMPSALRAKSRWTRRKPLRFLEDSS
ncbi:hypothetical protein OE88DRAFT_159416 [Heliocybe sulcata]|uniref:DNA helicase Pif1-like 2B domain-containing protein n=1 Tax=Heliocybe sulcata TaxID=5364 RepID=A0A5C3NMF9_9AGAM|nr:hypothetical protein OE88DRAFT_159416 [Heliocybe sulcata]